MIFIREMMSFKVSAQKKALGVNRSLERFNINKKLSLKFRALSVLVYQQYVSSIRSHFSIQE